MNIAAIVILGALAIGLPGDPALAAEACRGFGPQAPRDITNPAGSNPLAFGMAPAPQDMNLCNIHFHVNAEHKGPGFAVFAGAGEQGGYRCNDTASLTPAELDDPTHGHGACHGVKPGDTIEVHWVYSSCEAAPGKGLDACSSERCANPQLRVEAQVFLVVNDPQAADFGAFTHGGHRVGGRPQPKTLPAGTGKPVTFLGSTTGTAYSEAKCSPMQVTWSVRPACAKIDVASLNAWCAGNVFGEDHAHGVRSLVTAPELLAPIR